MMYKSLSLFVMSLSVLQQGCQSDVKKEKAVAHGRKETAKTPMTIDDLTTAAPQTTETAKTPMTIDDLTTAAPQTTETAANPTVVEESTTTTTTTAAPILTQLIQVQVTTTLECPEAEAKMQHELGDGYIVNFGCQSSLLRRLTETSTYDVTVTLQDQQDKSAQEILDNFNQDIAQLSDDLDVQEPNIVLAMVVPESVCTKRTEILFGTTGTVHFECKPGCENGGARFLADGSFVHLNCEHTTCHLDEGGFPQTSFTFDLNNENNTHTVGCKIENLEGEGTVTCKEDGSVETTGCVPTCSLDQVGYPNVSYMFDDVANNTHSVECVGDNFSGQGQVTCKEDGEVEATGCVATCKVVQDGYTKTSFTYDITGQDNTHAVDCENFFTGEGAGDDSFGQGQVTCQEDGTVEATGCEATCAHNGWNVTPQDWSKQFQDDGFRQAMGALCRDVYGFQSAEVFPADMGSDIEFTCSQVNEWKFRNWFVLQCKPDYGLLEEFTPENYDQKIKDPEMYQAMDGYCLSRFSMTVNPVTQRGITELWGFLDAQCTETQYSVWPLPIWAIDSNGDKIQMIVHFDVISYDRIHAVNGVQSLFCEDFDEGFDTMVPIEDKEYWELEQYLDNAGTWADVQYAVCLDLSEEEE